MQNYKRATFQTGLLFLILSAFKLQAALAVTTYDLEWVTRTIVPGTSDSQRPVSTIVLDAQGEPHIIFSQRDRPFHNEGNVFHAFRTGGTWEIETVAAYSSSLSVNPGAAFDNLGRLHIAYGEGQGVKYGLLSGGSWQLEPVPTPGLRVSLLSLAVDDNGNPHLAFDHNTSRGEAHYATFDGSDWFVEQIATSFSPFTIAIDAQGQPAVAGFSSGNLKVATHDSSGWSVETVGPGGLGASLVIDNAGVFHIGHAVPNADDLRYATNSGGTWTNDIVQNLGQGAQGASITLGADGLPQMAFEIHNGMPEDQVMHSYFDGTQWITGLVDPRISIESKPSLVVGDDGVAHVVYSVVHPAHGTLEVRYARTVVPEPSAGLLATMGILGCLGAAFARRRTRHK